MGVAMSRACRLAGAQLKYVQRVRPLSIVPAR